MAGPFDIRAATNTVTLGEDGQGEASFTVTNVSGRSVRGRAEIEVVSGDASAGTWLALAGEPERPFPIAATEQYTVGIHVPAASPAGSYTFRLNMVDVDNTDEGFSQGQPVTFVVPEKEVKPKPFPWWIIAAAAGVVIVAVVLLWIFVLSKTNMPNVVGFPFAAAQETVESARLVVGETIQVTQAETPGLVLASTPRADERLNRNSTVALVVALAPTSTATATPTPTATSTPTATGTPTATPTRTNTTAPLGSIVDHFVGTWNNVDDNSPVSRLVIQKVNNSTASIQVTASQPVTNWGTVNASHRGTQLTANWQFRTTILGQNILFMRVSAVFQRVRAAIIQGARMEVNVTYNNVLSNQTTRETYVFEQPRVIIQPGLATLVPRPTGFIIQPTLRIQP